MRNPTSHTSSYTPAQVAQMFGVKTTTVHAWLSRKEIRGNKVGHRRFITEQQIRDFVHQRKTGEFVDLTYSTLK
jgi:excisionase family DNA binding protein